MLGNSFSNDVGLIQWYEYTGTLGGTMWILIINILLFTIIKDRKTLTQKMFLSQAILCILLVLIPIILSLIRYYTYTEKENPREVIVIQPNVDPYKEKFGKMSSKEQVEKILRLSDS
ncbi:MAG: apolipoprotein N-acyltransferase, partial [Bacteroidales bacterium]